MNHNLAQGNVVKNLGIWRKNTTPFRQHSTTYAEQLHPLAQTSGFEEGECC